jgi:hypothetical protein
MPEVQRWLPNLVYVLEVRRTDVEGGTWAPANAPVFIVPGLAARFLDAAPIPQDRNLVSRITMYRRVSVENEAAVIAEETARDDETVDQYEPTQAIHVNNSGQVTGVSFLPPVKD